uniref:RGA-B2-2 n=1 Tax=Solanum chacoense TaxID=4108 RepID=A0A8E6YH26_SOLCH|nr:RGA-B2-2 [Solanum chacoense]
MADPVIGATVQVLLEKLLSLTTEEFSSSRDCNKDLRMLTQNVSMIQAFIHDAERRQVEDQSMKLWFTRLERAAENAENVFDKFRYESLKRQVKIRNNPMRKVSDFFSHTAFKNKMSRKINNINEELRAINTVAKNLGLQSLMVPPRKILPIQETDSIVVASYVVGRDNDVAEIKEKILTIREDIDLCTIPIVGIGGLGKTTVAKRIFNDEQIEKHFEKRVWLCLPEMSEIKSFLELILESLTKRKVEVQGRDIIAKKLQDELAGRKYLLVLDDLWRVDPTLWDEFVDTLRGINTSRGNFILVTTRMKLVASTVATVLGPHMLEKLSEDHCWSIFKQRAFVDGKIPEEIVSMEKRIVEMCQGLLLAASVLGGLLRSKEKHEWQAILDGNPLVADFEFEKEQLIQLWMAEGFLHPCQEIPAMEDVGHWFFQILLQHSLLQDVELDEQNNITHCKMHDLVHDLAGDILKSKLFDPKGDDGENLSQVRYFGFLPNSICELYNLQTFRVNDCFSLRELPYEMGNMISLRHIYFTSVDKRTLHWGAWCIHYNNFQMPLNMGQLTSLQTLQFFKVGLEKGRQIEELGHLKNLRGELRFKGLQLVCDKEEARTAYLQEKPNICKLAYLWSHDELEGCEINDEHVLDGLQPHPNLKSLAVVGFLGTKFPSWFIEESLPNLVKLKLSGCKKCKEIPSLGQLKFLRHLELVGFHELECIGPALYGVEISNIGSSSIIQVFPSLKELVLEDMHSLIEWKGDEVGVRMSPGLEKLRITDCPLLKSIPNQFEILRELEITGVDSEMPLFNLCSNLTSLVNLSVCNVKKLTCLPDEMLRNNVSLQYLSVTDCEEFRELPQSLYNLHSLKRLRIHSCTNFSSLPVPNGDNYLTSLQLLMLCNCDGLISLPIGMLDQCRSLEILSVSCCDNLVSFPLHVWEMPSLLYLEISRCPKLISVPEVGLHRLTGLWKLEIGPFSEMVDFDAFQLIFNGIQQLLSLRDLEVYGRGHWDSLPYQLMQLSDLIAIKIADFGIEALPPRLDNLTSLERLTLKGCKWLQQLNFSNVMPKLWLLWINDCPLLEALSDGLGNPVSLEELYLQDCEKLEHLPSRDAIRRLTKLWNLGIEGCPKLEENCINSQWSKISHIRNIEVGGRIIKDRRKFRFLFHFLIRSHF